jgi:phosphate transport system permease protein/phosphate transport system substrate-binding protein
MDKANQRSSVNASSLTVAAASVVAIILMLPYFGATTEQGINAYGQITPPSQLQEQQQGGGQGQNIIINGAGATFPFPLIDTWRVEYQSVNPSISINYQSIGSGGGVKQFTEKTVDFGASDAPLSQEEIQALSSSTPVHIPETIGSVVAAYNIAGIDKGLKLTGPLLSDIFLGKITKWDDARIKELNPGVPLPSADITVIHRSDGSGTTFIWTSYLSQVSPEWNQTFGAGKSIQWTVGLGAQGNEGVSSTIKSTPNSIGYVELTYALTTDMDYASLMNRAGNFVEPTLNSTQAAAQAAIMNSTSTTTNNETTTSAGTAGLPSGDQSWTHVTLLDAPGADSYPIASFSYLLLYKELSTNINSMEKAEALAEFVNWAITDGQQFASPLHYVPLPDSVVQHNQQTLKSLTFNGQPLLQ